MATARGTGLMVLPVFLDMTTHVQAADTTPSSHMNVGAGSMGLWTGIGATLAHGVGYLLTTALIAWIVYEKLGVGLLRSARVNFDLVWAIALVVTGGLTLLI